MKDTATDIQITATLANTESPKGSVLLAHGFGEHLGRYRRFRDALNENGFDTYQFDFTGHGTAGGPRARVDVGRLIGEHLHARKQVMGLIRTADLDLFGHSMGGLVTLASALLDPTRLAAVAVTGPALKPNPEMKPWLAKIASVPARLFPGLPTVALDINLLARDPQVAADYLADPLVFDGKVPLVSGTSMVIQGLNVLDNASMLAVPTLIIHGDEDGLASVKGSIEFVEAAGENAELVIIDGGYHELLNEPEHREYTDLIVQWYDRW